MLQQQSTFVDAAKGALANEAFQLKAAELGTSLLQQLRQNEEGRLEPHQAAGVTRHPLCGIGPPRSLHHGVVKS